MKFAVAAMFDLFKFICCMVVFLVPVAEVLDIAAWGLFFLWFAISGVKMFGGARATNRFLAAATSSIVGAIPFVNMFPTIIAGVITIEYQSWQEAKEKAAKEKPKQSRGERIREQQEEYSEAT